MTSNESTHDGAGALAGRLARDIEGIDRELAEIEMLAAQARSEAARHEQRRAAAADKVAAAAGNPALADLAAAFNQLVTLTRRATLMEAQGELLDAKRKALARHRADLVSLQEAVSAGESEGVAAADGGAGTSGAAGALADGPLPPTLSRVVMSAQEDLRRDIARSMHDGPAQALTNVVLQTQIVDRLLDRDPAAARAELRVLAQMVQQTLDTTKDFIFDVRPMVLDDLGLVPTLRRATRERGRRAHVAVEFESHGQDRRLPMDLESTLFRMLDQALGAYLAQGPERASLTLEWGPAELLAVVAASRAPVYPAGEELPPVPGDDVPDTMRRMIQERHDAHAAAVAAAETAARLPLPAAVRRDLAERASAAGATVEVVDAGEVRITLALPEADSGAAP